MSCVRSFARLFDSVIHFDSSGSIYRSFAKVGEHHNASLGAASTWLITIITVVVGEYRWGKIGKSTARIQDG